MVNDKIASLFCTFADALRAPRHLPIVLRNYFI
jgi:hypothetical protein